MRAGRLPESEQLLSALQGGSSVSFSVEASDFKSEESNFRFESDVSCRVPFMWFLSVFDVNHTHDMSSISAPTRELRSP